MAEWLLDHGFVTGDGVARFDGPGARDLAGQLEQLASAWEQAVERRLAAGGLAARSWTGPLGHDFASRLAVEEERGRRLVQRLRGEARAWRGAADEAERRL
jgi:hypothetical protein